MRNVISTPNAPKAIGPYSQAIRARGLVFVSGQVAIDPATQQVMEGDVAAQTERVIKNLSAILSSAESSLDQVVRTTVFLKNMNDFAAMNEVYGKFFGAKPPARAQSPKKATVCACTTPAGSRMVRSSTARLTKAVHSHSCSETAK